LAKIANTKSLARTAYFT